MQITIRLLAAYRRYLPENCDGQGGYPQEVVPSATAGDVLASLSIPPGEALSFFVNGHHAERDHPLQAGDVLTVFPAVGGG